MQNTKRHHFYTFPELLGQALVIVVLVTAMTGAFRLIETILPVSQSVVAQTIPTRSITSVSTYIQQGYIQNSLVPDIEPLITIVEPASAELQPIIPPEPQLI